MTSTTTVVYAYSFPYWKVGASSLHYGGGNFGWRENRKAKLLSRIYIVREREVVAIDASKRLDTCELVRQVAVQGYIDR
jgi:hypothetical protein